MTNPICIMRLDFITILLNALTFSINVFALRTYENSFLSENLALYIKFTSSSLFLLATIILHYFNNKPLISRYSHYFSYIYQLLEISLFLNIEYSVYWDFSELRWIGIFRISGFLLKYMVNFFEMKFHAILRVFFILVIFNLSFIIMKDFKWSIFLLVIIEIILFLYLFENYANFIVEKLKNRNIAVLKEFDVIHDGVLIIKGVEIEFFNNKFLNFLKIEKNQAVFSEINKKIHGFSLYKISPNEQVSKDSIQITINSHKNSFESLREILSFCNSNNKDNNLIHLIQNHNFDYEHRMKLKIKHEKILDETYYYFSFKKIDKILNLKEKFDNNNRLLNSFTHELKTPLNGSIPILEEIRSQISASTTIYIDRAIASLKLLENSLNNIIDYSLRVSDQFIIHLSSFDLEELLAEIFMTVKSQMELKSLDFTIEIAEELSNKKIIMSDFTRLKQLILNILLNALQFTNKGNIILSATISFNDPLKISFSVEDTGMGIEEEKLEKLRQKLKEGNENEFQMNSTGYCLGLTVSQNIALLLGKEGLEITSNTLEGTIVKFSIIDQTPNEQMKEFKDLIGVKENCDSGRKLRKISMSTKTMNILECSKYLHSIRTKNYALQKTLKEQSLSGILSDEEKILANSDSDLNLGKIITHYNFEKLNVLINREKSEKSSKDVSPMLKIESIECITRKSRTKSPKKTLISLHNINIMQSPLLRENNGTLQKIMENDEYTQNDNKKVCKCKSDDILIVDDDTFNLLSLEMILKGFSFDCVKAMNGEEAIHIIKNRRCDSVDCKGAFKLIFMDYQMPILDGVETTIEINNLIAKKSIKYVTIIGCTAFTAKDEISRCLNAGMKDVIFKPLSKNLIGNILKEWV